MGARSDEHRRPSVQGDRAIVSVAKTALGSSQRGHQVFGSPHERDDVGCSRKRRGGEHPGGRLTEGNDAEADQCLCRGRFGEHHDAIVGRGKSCEIEGEVVGAGRIHANDGRRRIYRVRHERIAGRGPVARCDGVFEVEDHGIRSL